MARTTIVVRISTVIFGAALFGCSAPPTPDPAPKPIPPTVPEPRSLLPAGGKSIVLAGTKYRLPNGNILDLSWVVFCHSESGALSAKAAREKVWRESGVTVKSAKVVSLQEADGDFPGFHALLLNGEPTYWPYLRAVDPDNNEVSMQAFGVGGKPDVALAITEALAQVFAKLPTLKNVRVVGHKPRGK